MQTHSVLFRIVALSMLLYSLWLFSSTMDELEKKVSKHNNLVERMVKVESSVKSAHHRIDELKNETEE